MLWPCVKRPFRFREALSERLPWKRRLDEKDFRLLVALHEDARASYRSLGQRVSLTAPAVRERLHRLEAKGVLHGFWLTPDPQVLGRKDLLVLFGGERTRADAEKALAIPEVAWVAWKMDGGLTVQVWARGVASAVKRLSSVLGSPPTHQTVAERRDHGLLTELDWRILEALVDDPRLPLGDLCERTGLSPKTVRKHLAKMLREESVYITPRMGSLGDAGEIVFPLLVLGNVRAAEVRRIMGDALLVNDTEVPPTKYFYCRVPDMSQVTERVQNVRKLPGVESAMVTLNRELLINMRLIRELVHEQVSRSASSPRRTAPRDASRGPGINSRDIS